MIDCKKNRHRADCAVPVGLSDLVAGQSGDAR